MTLAALLLNLVLTLGLLAVPAAKSFAISENEAFPTRLSIESIKGPALSNESLAGKVTLINFWATWCQACKVEIKEMEGLFKDLSEANPRFQIAFVSLDKDPAKAVTWFGENLGTSSFKDRLYKDPEFKAAEILGIDSFPMTLVVNAKGQVIKVQRGFEKSKGLTESLRERIDAELKVLK